MKSLTKTSMLAAALTCALAGPANADGVDLAQVLRGGPTCDHVIHLMLRHGINNNHGAIAPTIPHHSPFGQLLIPAADLGDLELVSVAQIEVVDPACGPKFVVTVRNNSTRDVCGFRITLVALYVANLNVPVIDYPDLVELIQNTISPEFWDVVGGPGTIMYYRPLLAIVVRATSEVHHQVGGAMDALRRAGGR